MQIGLPYFAVGATTGLIMHKISRRKLLAEVRGVLADINDLAVAPCRGRV